MPTPALQRLCATALFACWLGVFSSTCAAGSVAPKAVQVDVRDILNARVIAVAKDGVVTPLRDDIDGAGGLATNAAAKVLDDKNAHPLPDNATFPATKNLPQVILNYSNDDTTQNQARRSSGEDTFFLPVPANHYDHFDLFCTSGQGASRIVVKLIYADRSVELRNLEVPDWFWDLKPDDTYRAYLIADMGKWDKKSKMIEQNHHSIFSVDVTPSPEKVLTEVAVHKMDGGLMVFYGATGTVAPK